MALPWEMDWSGQPAAPKPWEMEWGATPSLPSLGDVDEEEPPVAAAPEPTVDRPEPGWMNARFGEGQITNPQQPAGGVDPGFDTPVTADQSSAAGDLRAGMLQMGQLPSAAAVAGGVKQIERAGAIDAGRANAERLGFQISEEDSADMERRKAELVDKGVDRIVGALPGILERSAQIQQIPTNPAAERAMNAPTYGEALSALGDDVWGTSRTFVLRSLPSAAPTVLGAIVGTALGGPIGGAAGAGATSGMIDFTSTVASNMEPMIRDAGVDPDDPAAVGDFIRQNPEPFKQMLREASARSIAVGGFDAASGGITGSLAKWAAAGPVKRKVGATVGGIAADAAAGGAGEYAGQKAAPGSGGPGDVLAEVVGGLATGGPMELGQMGVEIARERRGSMMEPLTAPPRPDLPVTPEQIASPIPTAALQEGQAILESIAGPAPSALAKFEAGDEAERPVAAAQPPVDLPNSAPAAAEPLPEVPNEAPEAPSAEAEAPSGTPAARLPWEMSWAAPSIEDQALLLGAGYSPEDVTDMNAAEIVAEATQAREQGVQPLPVEEAQQRLAMAAPGNTEVSAPAMQPVAPTAAAIEQAAAAPIPEAASQDALPASEPAAVAPVADEGAAGVAVPAPSTREIEAAAAEAHPAPTEAQAEAGNFRMGHVKVHGLDVTVETAKGNTRPGRDAPIAAHYGYIRGTSGKDGDHVDVYVADRPESDRAFVIDQYDPKTGRFDEHKTVLGANTREEAEAIYDAGFSDGSGPNRRRGITEMSVAGFKKWLKDGDQSSPTVLISKPVAASPAPRTAPVPVSPSNPASFSEEKRDKSPRVQKKPFTYRMKAAGIDPASPAAAELAHAGITPRNTPGLFRRGGLKDVDNLPAQEWQDVAAEVGVEGDYLSRQGVIDALVREHGGEAVRSPEQQGLASEEAAVAERARRVETAHAFVANRSFRLSDDERGRLAERIADSDGDPEDVVEQFLIHEAENAEAADDQQRDSIPGWESGPAASAPEADGRGAGQPEVEPRPEAAGAASGAQYPGRARDEARPLGRTATREGGSIDITPEGEQRVIPGAEQISDRKRAERAQNAPKRGGNKPLQDDGLFGDPNDRGDMFDPPFAKARGVELTGRELAPPDASYETLRRAATDWYRANLQGTEVVNRESGRTVKFGGAGRRKVVTGKGPDLLRMVPGLRGIIEDGRFIGEPEVDRRGREGIAAVHRLEATVEFNGRPVDVVVIIRETAEGELFYDLRKDNREGARWAVSSATAEGSKPHPALDDDAFADLNLEYAGAPIKERRTTPGGRVAYEPTSEFDEKAQAVAAGLQRRLDSLKLPGLKAGVANRLFARDAGGNLTELDGLANPQAGIVVVSLSSTRGAEITLGHEALHALKGAGLFRNAEWTAMERNARADTARMDRAREEYADLSDAEQVEEVIADQFGEWWAGRQEAKGFVRSGFERLRAFLQALRSALRGEGFTTAESVFRRAERGDVGRRYQVGKPIGDGSGVAVVRMAKGRDGILAFHGSPHDFDRFDLSKIGTGEGAQAFGYGLYFAESEGVARRYRDALSSTSLVGEGGKTYAVDMIDGWEGFIEEWIPYYLGREGVPADKVDAYAQVIREADGLVEHGGRFDQDLNRIAEQIEDFADDGGPGLSRAKYREIAKLVEAIPQRAEMKSAGRMYEVRIDADPGGFLDWDAPLSEQSEKVREAIGSAAPHLASPGVQKHASGQDAYRGITGKLAEKSGGDPRSAGPVVRSALREAGIAGIRYLDRGSRGAGEGTRNYVVFDDSLVTVTRKYAKARPSGVARIEQANILSGFDAAAVAEQGKQDDLFPRNFFEAPPETAWNRFWRFHKDDKERLYRAQRAIEKVKGSPIEESVDAYLATNLYETRRNDRLKRLHEEVLGDILTTMDKRKVSPEDLRVYLIARHAPERNAVMAQRNPKLTGPGSGVTDAAAAKLLADLDGEGKTKALQEVAAKIDKMIADDLSHRLLAGLITQEQYDAWKRMYQHYVPLRGYAERDDGEENQTGGIGRGFDIRGPEVRKALGRLSQAEHPLFMAAQMAQEGIIRAEKNRAGKTLYRMAERYTNDDLFRVVGKLPTRVVRDLKTGSEVRTIDYGALNRDRILAVKFGGKEKYLELSPELAFAMKNLGAQSMNGLIASLHAIVRTFSRLATGANPDFFIPNAESDFFEALMTAAGTKDVKKLGRRFAKNYGIALEALTAQMLGRKAPQAWEGYIDEWREAGGKMEFLGFRTLSEIESDIERRFNRTGKLRRVKQIAHLPIEAVRAIERFNAPFENASRLAMYVSARQSGVSKAKAAFLSLEASGNFMRRGTGTSTMGALYPFYNASVAGAEKFARFASNPKVAAFMATVPIMSMLWAAHLSSQYPDDDDPEKRPLYFKISPWERSRSIIIPTGTDVDENGAKRLTYATVRLPYNLRALWTLGDQLAGLKVGTITVADAINSIVAAAAMSFNPLGGDDAMSAISPLVLDPALELSRNRDAFDSPIHPEPYAGEAEGVPAYTYFSGRTGPAFVWMAQGLNDLTGGNSVDPGLVSLYPNQLEYLWDFVSGGLGRFMTRAWEAGVNLPDGVPTPRERIPVLRAAIGKTTPRAESDRFYEISDDMADQSMRLTNAKKLIERGDPNAGPWGEVEEQAAKLGAKVEKDQDIVWRPAKIGWKDAAVLFADGYDPKDVVQMSKEEREAKAIEAKARGVAPIEKEDAMARIEDARRALRSLPAVIDDGAKDVAKIRDEIRVVSAQTELSRADKQARLRELQLKIEMTMRETRAEFVKRTMEINAP